MNITFGILSKNNQRNVNNIVDSIISQNIPSYEVFILGAVEDTWHMENIHIIQDDIDNNKNHITKKKNDIIRNAKYETIVIMKDYLRLSSDWYKGLLKFGECFDILMNKIVDNRGRRYLDWIWENPRVGDGRNVSYDAVGHPRMFSPGAFTMAKKYVFDEFLFNEKMVGLGRPTDVQWSNRAMEKYSYLMNIHSSCELIDRHNRYPKFRRMCDCELCIVKDEH
tara:strand:+ start:20798 stop:21466 length:669 start_codon:yes stop_codon:yes gene_type:complete